MQVSRIKLSLIRADRPTVMTRHLMDLVFSRDEMANSSVTGRASNKTVDQPAKKALDTVKVAAVIGKCGKCCYSNSLSLFLGPDLLNVVR